MHRALLLLLCLGTAAYADPPLRIISASAIGGDGDDSLDAVCIAPDGSIYVAGNSARPLDAPAGAAPSNTLGPAGGPYGVGFVLHLSADGKTLLQRLDFGAGMIHLTTVECNTDSVYIAGYATESADAIVYTQSGLIPRHPRPTTLPHYTPREHTEPSNPQPDKSMPGVPIVVRIDAQLKAVQAATYLEGRHTIWHVPKPLDEPMEQPVAIAILSDGDIAVCHDGGPLADMKPGAAPSLVNFYSAVDHLSRLSGDLKQRRWQRDIASPAVNRAFMAEAMGAPWNLDWAGNVRSFRLRADVDDNLYLAGWSASRTTKEPWWSPFLRKYDRDGDLKWQAWEFDPTSGADRRMNNLVSDSAIRSVNIDPADGSVLVATIGDGGNSVLLHDPHDYARLTKTAGDLSGFHGRTLFWGMAARLKEDGSFVAAQGLSGHGIPPPEDRQRRSRPPQAGLQPAWAADLGPLPGGRAIIAGRCSTGFASSKDAWFSGPGGLIALLDHNMHIQWSSALPDVVLSAMAVRGPRAAIIGQTRGKSPLLQNAIEWPKRSGRDGYLIILDAQD